MKKIFSVFDHEENDKVTVDELKTIMRALDINVEKDGALERIKKMIDPNDLGYITFAALKNVMEEELRDNDTIEQFIE